jgi:hypothetical protein
MASLSGCGKESGADGSANVSIVSVDPEGGYPGVEALISFLIEPDAKTEADAITWEVRLGDGRSQAGEGTSGEVRHVYERPGQFRITVEARVDSTTIGSATREYRVFDPVDIAARTVSGSPRNRNTGEDVTVSIDLSNQTAAPVETAFDVAAYLAPNAQVGPDDIDNFIFLGQTTVEAAANGVVLEGGASRNVGFTATIPEINGGQYYLVAVVDPLQRVADTDRLNNFVVSQGSLFIENVSQMLPDIAVTNVYALPDRAFPNLNRLVRGFTLSNVGNENVFNVIHKTYISVGSPALDDNAILVHTSDPINLPARAELEVGPTQYVLNQEIIPPADGSLDVYVIVTAYSTDGNVVEISEDNNVSVSSQPILVTDQPVDGPDIAVLEFTVTPESTFLDGTLSISTRIANEGTVDVASFFCGIYMGRQARVDIVNDPRLANINIASLASGQEREIERTITVPSLYNPGVYYLYIVCDPLGALQEAYRSNNEMLYLNPITITDEADIDMYVDALRVPASAEDGDAVEIVATICVAGSNPTGNTVAHLYRNNGTTVDFNQAPFQVVNVPNINPGDCLDLTFEIEALCTNFNNRLSFGFVVDATDRLPETDETNNRRSGSNPLQMEGMYCQCVEDPFHGNQQPLRAVEVSQGSYDASICTSTCDFYKVFLNARDSVTITTTYEANRGALETTMYDTSGIIRIQEDATPGYQQVGYYLAPSAGQYIFSICGKNQQRNYYSFDVDVISQPEGIDVLPRQVTLPVRDSFSVGATVNTSFRAYNLGTQPTGDFEAHVVLVRDRAIGNPDDLVLATQTVSSLGAGTFRNVTIPVLLPPTVDDGEYYLAIVLDPGAALDEENRDNNVAFSPALRIETRCYDPFSPNQSFAAARSIGAGSYSNLVVCADAPDYFQVCVDHGKRLTATINFRDADGDIDLALYDSERRPLATSAGSGVDTEQVRVEYVNGAQCYYLHVYLLANEATAQNTYSLNVQISDVDEGLQCSGAFEPNNSFATASSLVAALNHTQLLDRCPVEDVDFYYVYLTVGQRFTITGSLDPTNQPGTLRMQLYRPNQTPVATTETAPGVPSVTIAHTAAVTGTYYLQVSIGGTARRVTYGLEATGLRGIDLAPSSLRIGSGSYRADDLIRFDFSLSNLGPDLALRPAYKLYLSTSTTLNVEENVLLGTFTAPDVAGNATVTVEGQAVVPDTFEPALHYLHVIVDPDHVLNDTNRANNVTSTTINLVE